MFSRFDRDLCLAFAAVVVAGVIAVMFIGCEGATSLTIPTSILAPMDTASASSEAISIASSGQTIILNAVRNEHPTEGLSSYIELEVLPSALSDITISRNDTEFGSNVTMTATGSPPKIGLFSRLAELIGAAIGGGGGAVVGGPAGAGVGAVTGAALGAAATP